MKTKIFLIGICFALLTACTTQSLVVDEMVITDAKQFKQFKTEHIAISTKEPVKVFYNYPNNKGVSKVKILNNEQISNYQFATDSLFVDDAIFRSIIALKTINQINFKGLWNDELGFVSENEINSYYNPKLSRTGSVILGTIAGGTLGILTGWLVGAITGTKINLYGGSRTDQNNIKSGMLIGGLLGSIIGGIIGVNIFSSEPQDLEQILVEIKKGRK